MPESERPKIFEVFKIDCGRFWGDNGEGGELFPYLLDTMLFFTMSTGTGFIITLELRFFNVLFYYYSFLIPDLFELFFGLTGLPPPPQLINLDDLIISTGLVAEFWTFSLNLERIFLIPLSFNILANSYYCFIFLLASSYI